MLGAWEHCSLTKIRMNDNEILHNGTAKKVQRLFTAEQTFEYFVQILVTGGFLATLLSRNGVPDFLVGIISSFISLTCIVQIFSAKLVRKASGVKRTVFLLILFNEIIFLLLYVIPLFSIPTYIKCIVFVVFIFTAYVLYNLVAPLKFSWYMLFVPTNERGRYTAKKEIISLLGGIVFSFIMGTLSDYYNERGQENTAFIICAVAIFAVSVVHISSILSTPAHSLDVSSGKGFFSSLKALKNRAVVAVLVLEIMWRCAMFMSNPFYGIYQTKELGFTLTQVSLLAIIQSVTRSSVSFGMGKIADRYGWRINLTLCLSAAFVSYGVMIFCTPGNGLIIYGLHNVFMGIAQAGINSGLMNIYFDYVPTAERTATLGVKAAIGGVFGFLTTTIAGLCLARMQESEMSIAGTPVYAQQILSLVSAIITVIAVFYAFFVIKRLHKAE